MEILDHNAWVSECRMLSNSKYVLGKLNQFDASLSEIIRDVDGERVLEAGCAIFFYLSIAVADSSGDAIRLWNSVKVGYPDHPHSDLIVPYADVVRTQNIWLNASNILQERDNDEKVEIVLNILFRWHIAAIELMRKTLCFCEYWLRSPRETIDSNRMHKLLYRGGDPTPSLLNIGDRTTATTATQFYIRDSRHALAHGNVICNLPDSVGVRFTNITEGRYEEKKYDLRNGSNGINSLIADLHDTADRNYQAIRVFFLLYAYIDSKYSALISKDWSKYPQDDLLKDTVRNVLK